MEEQTIVKCRLKDIAEAKFLGTEGEKPSYCITPLGEKINRVCVIGTITEKYVADNSSFATLTIDDGTDAIRLRVFREDVKTFDGFDQGEQIIAMGKVRTYNQENYVTPDSIRKVEDSNYENLWNAEMAEKLVSKKQMIKDIKSASSEMSEEEITAMASERYGMDAESMRVVLESKQEEVDYKPRIMELMSKLDNGDGVEMGKLLELSGIDESMAEAAISELLSSGDLYEPKVGKLKRVRA